MNTAIYTLTSPLHDTQTVEKQTQTFLQELNTAHDYRDGDFSDYGSHALSLIFVRTGGTENVFLPMLPMLRERSRRPFRLLTSGESNSLAASMEILSYLRQQGIEGEIIHGNRDYMARRIHLLERAEVARQKLRGSRLGVVGRPSDWLISSHADPETVMQKTGMTLVDIGMDELLDIIARTPLPKVEGRWMPGAIQIYESLKQLVARYRLQGLTLRCFDLLTSVRNTGCLALARLNAEGTVAGCEGDVPALLSMMIAQAATGVTGFQSNPAHIDAETGELLLAHCTIPLNMVERYEMDTHFESGIGVAVRGYMPPGPVTVFKTDGKLQRSLIAEGELLRCEARPNLCRTQAVVRLNEKEIAHSMLTHPVGNHHILLPGHHAEVLKSILE